MKKIRMAFKRDFYKKDFKYRLENTVKNFHLSMLTEEKQNEISGRKCSQFKNDIKLSENEHNYVLSICFRKTFIQNGNVFYSVLDSDSAAVTTAVTKPEQTKTDNYLIRKLREKLLNYY